MKKTLKVTVLAAVFLVLTGGSTSCKDKEKDETCATCENKQIIHVLKDEPGYIQGHNLAAVDRVTWITFEPLNPIAGSTKQLLICPSMEDEVKEYRQKYPPELVTVSGSITNCIQTFVDNILEKDSAGNPIKDSAGEYIRITYTHNILELSSVKKLKIE